MVLVIPFAVPFSSSLFQPLLYLSGGDHSLTPSNFTNVVNSQNATAKSLLINVGSNCPAVAFWIRLFVASPEEGGRFIIDNSLQLAGSFSKAFAMPRATTSTTPVACAFVNSVLTTTGANFGVIASLPNTTHIQLSADLSLNCQKIYVSYLVIESTANDTLYWSLGTIQMAGSTVSYPSYDPTYWTDYLVGLVRYNVPTDGNWSCSSSPMNCTGMQN